MKNLAIVAILLLSLISCKEKQAKNNPGSEVGQTKDVKVAPKTYAELSVKEKGEWQGRKFIGDNKFKNVGELQAPDSLTDHSYYIRYEGPGWENGQIAYRLYLDWRNAIDIFGKKVDSLVLPYVGQDGYDSYHEAAPWGQDILKAGKAMGIGGYGREVGDTIVHFQKVESTYAKIDNLEDRSTVNISYKGWKTGDDIIDLHTQLSIYPQDRYTKAELTPSKEINGICTGIVKFKDIPLFKKSGAKWAYMATYGTQTLVNDTDKLGMAIFYKTDEVAAQKEGANDHLLLFKPTTKTLTYYFLGAWDQEKNGIQNKEDFIKDLNKKLDALDSTGSI